MSVGFVDHMQVAIKRAEDNTRSPMDKLGYYPVVGSISGPIRAVYGVAKAVFSALMLIGSIIFTNKTHNWDQSAKDGLLHTGRGVVEFFTFIGTGSLLRNYDDERANANKARNLLYAVYG